MKSISISSLGDIPVVLGGEVAVGLLEQVEAVDPHLEGEKVWHQVTTLTQRSSLLAWRITSVMPLLVTPVPLKTRGQGSLRLAFIFSHISLARASTVSRTSSPYRNWEPTTNQNS